MGTGGPKYGYLALARRYGGVVSYPGWEQKRFDEHSEAEAAWLEWIEEQALPQAVKEAEAKRKVFIEGCEVRVESHKQPGLMTPDRIERRIFDAEGNFVSHTTAEAFGDVVQKAALEKFPEPGKRSLAANLGGVEQRTVWAVALYLDSQSQRLPSIWDWDFGFPIQDALRILNDLASEGWTVANVSEDRGIYKGATNQTDSAVTTVRYLLVRDT